jgi:hypothetical protein
MLNHSYVLRQFQLSRQRIAFDVTNAEHLRAAITFFNAESANHHKWIDEETGKQFQFIDELEYPSLPDMVREKLMFAHIRAVTGRNEIEDTYQVLARQTPASLLKYQTAEASERARAQATLASTTGVRVVDIKTKPSDPRDVRNAPRQVEPTMGGHGTFVPAH